MRYEYTTETGERREIFGSMKDPPPEVIHEDGREWRRLYTVPQAAVKPDVRVRNKGMDLPVSFSLPTRDTSEGTPTTLYGHSVLQYKDGTHTTMEGERIIDTQRAVDVAKAQTGMTRE